MPLSIQKWIHLPTYFMCVKSYGSSNTWRQAQAEAPDISYLWHIRLWNDWYVLFWTLRDLRFSKIYKFSQFGWILVELGEFEKKNSFMAIFIQSNLLYPANKIENQVYFWNLRIFIFQKMHLLYVVEKLVIVINQCELSKPFM